MKNRAANLSPCERCGACCATFRVDFSIMETQAEGGAVPDGLALPVAARTCRLRGTDHLPPRCAALSGRVGERGYVIMSSSGTEAVLTVLAKQNAKLGLLFLDIKRAAEALSKLI